MTQPDALTPAVPGTPEPSPEPEKTFTQAELDRIVADRVKRAKPADYDELKTAASKLAEIENAQKTAEQKAADAQAAADRRAADAEAKALRLEVAFSKGLTPAQAKRLVGSTREELEADADEILTEFPVKSDGRPKGNADQGVRPSTPPANKDERETARALFAKT